MHRVRRARCHTARCPYNPRDLIATLTVLSAASCARNSGSTVSASPRVAPSHTAPASSSVSASPTAAPNLAVDARASCALDPDHSWVTSQDRGCKRDVDCTTVLARGCAMFAVAAQAAQRVSSGEYACPPIPSLPGRCMCAMPLFEQRCFAGCCQSRIYGGNGSWRPLQ